MWSWITRNEKSFWILAGSTAITVLLSNVDFNLLEANLYDLRMAHGPQKSADSSITLVTLDDRTIRALDEFSPLPLDFHARFLEALEKLEPRAVGYLIDLNQANQLNPDLAAKPWADRFVETANRMQSHGTTLLLGTPFDVTGEVVPPFPLSTLPHALALLHKDGNVFAEDKITRRALISLNGKPLFHAELASRLGELMNPAAVRGEFLVPEIDGKYFFFRYHGNTAMKPKHPDRLPYQRISFLEILQGKFPDGALRGKIVLVGTLAKEDSGDFAFTPYSKASYTNPRLVVHANILDSLLHNDGIRRAPTWVNWLTTFAVTSFVLWWVLSSTPLYGVFATLGLATLFLVVGHLAFTFGGTWLRESQPLVGIFLAYYLTVPYRLILEYKKRWDYQRQNEILTQVEELKTNFLSLVTHDLKTPVARIQGLAEVVLKTSSGHLTDQGRETLRHIIYSTEELNQFISSILELSKIESDRLRLNLESKDVNQLIERAVERLHIQARNRKITIQTHLEPMFPIRLDPSLISKVINNLIDNAIKYSPANSEIHIESKEVDGWITFSVRDQGIGMTPEESENLFTRFYRAKNDATASISGTGLGLYLTKYFIEAHQGRVELETEKGKGTTFRIYLPIEAPATAASPFFSFAGAKLPKPGLLRRLSFSRTKLLTSRVEKENAHV